MPNGCLRRISAWVASGSGCCAKNALKSGVSIVPGHEDSRSIDTVGLAPGLRGAPQPRRTLDPPADITNGIVPIRPDERRAVEVHHVAELAEHIRRCHCERCAAHTANHHVEA